MIPHDFSRQPRLHLQRYLGVLVVGVLIYTAWSFLSRVSDRSSAPPNQRHTAGAAEFDRIYGGTELKILQFYVRDGSMIEGSTTALCYGVVNARTVRIEPEIQDVAPSISRCVEVAPKKDTRYTLTAVGKDGRTVSESVSLAIRPDVAALPRISSFRVASRTSDYAGRVIFSLAFNTVNAEQVSIDPPVLPALRGAPSGRFYVAPQTTTTYTLTVTNKHGRKVQQQLTVEVPRF